MLMFVLIVLWLLGVLFCGLRRVLWCLLVGGVCLFAVGDFVVISATGGGFSCLHICYWVCLLFMLLLTLSCICWLLGFGCCVCLLML